YLEFTPPKGSGYAVQFWNGQLSLATAAAITVGGTDVANIDAHLVAGYAATGTVTDAFGTPVSGSVVDAFLATGPCCFLIRSDVTDQAGHFLLELASGASYKVRFAG